MSDLSFLDLPNALVSRLDVGWSLLLFLTRYATMLMVLPGIGGGMQGLYVRYPFALVLAVVSLTTHPPALLPADMGIMAGQFVSELVLGGVVSMVPLMIVAGAQTAGQIASGTMGLNGAQLIDPTTNVPISDISRIYSDLTVVIFLVLGGHYVAIGQLAGLSVAIQPGTFVLGAAGVESLIMQSAHIFEIGCMIAAPVIVALLLTNFVMALISKAVPTVNLFMLSFPLTIGIGFILSALALPEVAWFLRREILEIEKLTTLVLG